MSLNQADLPHIVVGACMEVHRQLGPGLIDSAYRACLAREFQLRELIFQRDVPLNFDYKDRIVQAAGTLDFIVEGTILVHVYALPPEDISPLHKGRLVTHLKLADIPCGLLVNFNVENLRLGIRRAIVSNEGRFADPAYSGSS